VLRSIIHFFRDAALDPLVHRSALESLFWGSLSAEGISGLLLGLVLRDVAGAHHVSRSWGTSKLWVLWSDCFVVVSAARRALILRIAVCTRRCDIVCLAVLLNLRQNTKASLWRNKTRNNFLRYILRRSPKQILQLNWAELLDDRALLADTLMESFFKFV